MLLQIQIPYINTLKTAPHKDAFVSLFIYENSAHVKFSPSDLLLNSMSFKIIQFILKYVHTKIEANAYEFYNITHIS